MTLSPEELLGFIKSKGTVHLSTLDRRKGFTAKVIAGCIEVTPDSTGKARTLPVTIVQRFCHEYAQRWSQAAGAYREVTFDASYLLAMIDSMKRDRSLPRKSN